MKTPHSLGLPPEFKAWRQGQDRAVKSLLFSKKRFPMVVTPTGSGKSVTYMADVAADETGRSIVMTDNLILASQNHEKFQSIGMEEIRGRGNYTCDLNPSHTAANAICMSGMYCKLKKSGGCTYYNNVDIVKDARIVQTNYKCWMHHDQTFGSFDRMVCDEAHKLPSNIEEFAAVEVTAAELMRYGCSLPKGGIKGLSDWALLNIDRVTETLDKFKGRRVEYIKGRDLLRKLARLCKLHDEQWVMDRNWTRWRWDLVNPGDLAEYLVFRGVAKVILASATIRPKTLEILGVKRQDMHLIEQDSTFPLNRRPIWYWPVAKIGRNSSSMDFRRLHQAMSNFADRRKDRRGLIMGVSYDRSKSYMESLAPSVRRRLVIHGDDEHKNESIEEFVKRYRDDPRRNVIGASPAIDTGVDFPYEECEFIMCPKVPFPNVNTPLMKMRISHDNSYPTYVATQRMCQSFGRGNRFPDDSCEVVVFDANFGWVRGGYADFIPQYIHKAIRTVKVKDGYDVGMGPEPLEKL